MKVVLLNENSFINYNVTKLNGYKFNPKRNITNLVIINEELLKLILTIKINKQINKIRKAIILMINSNATIISDCDMMEDELYKLVNNIEIKYKKYFDESEYFELIKSTYELNMEISLKKKVIANE